MSHLQSRVITHAQRVCSLYKKACRDIESKVTQRDYMRVHIVLLRDRFDKNKNIKDQIEAQKILEAGETELFMGAHPFPKKFPHSPGGVAYEREVIAPDWVLDYWDPIEKAAFPDYFAKREQRKKDFIKLYESDFGRNKTV